MSNRVNNKHQSIEIYPYTTTFETTLSPNTLSLLSWNITHKDFITEYPYGTSNDLDWQHRLPRIKSKLSQSNADIICLQEIDKESFTNDIGTYFEEKHGYTIKCNYHPKQKKNNVVFSQCIMFKSSKYECHYEDYRGRATILLLTNKEKCNKCMKKKQICLYHSFFVVTVHLESPRKNKNNANTRVSQLKAILKKGIKKAVIFILKIDQNDIQTFNKEISNLRVIIAGDFNSGYECPPAQMLLSNNDTQYKHLYQFKDVYNEMITSGDYNHDSLPNNNCNLRIKYFPTYAAIGNIFSIDLMVYTANNVRLKGVTYTLPKKVKDKLNWDKVMEERVNDWIVNDGKTNKNGQYHLCDFSNILQLPNHDIPSDHLPLAAIFQFEDMCALNNGDNKECRCCTEYVDDKKNVKMKKSKEKKRNKVHNQYMNSYWKFHQINSF